MGRTLGGIIVDSGNFDWKNSGKFPWITQPNPSYHGLSFVDVAGRAAWITQVRAVLLRDMGVTLSPFHAFLLLQGLETLSLRVERHVENAKKVVEYLSGHPMVKKVNHPALAEGEQRELYQRYFPNGGGSIFTFEIRGKEEQAKKFIDHLATIFSIGQCSGCEISSNTSSFNDTFPTHRRRVAGAGDFSEYRETFHRNGEHRGYFGRFGAWFCSLEKIKEE